MKRFMMMYLVVSSFLCVFTGCTKSNVILESTIKTSEKIELDNEYRNAYANCIFYIKNSSNSNRNIDTSIVSVELLNENQKELVHIINTEDERYFEDEDLKYWLFTIGDTKVHNYIVLVCDSQSDNVIGSVPTK